MFYLAYEPLSEGVSFSVCSSQVLFSISQKLIQRQLVNYTEILKWLRDILVCRNTFLQKHSANANLGNNKTICIHIKLEVSLYSWNHTSKTFLFCKVLVLIMSKFVNLILRNYVLDFRLYFLCTCGALTLTRYWLACPAFTCCVRRQTLGVGQTRWRWPRFCPTIMFMLT